MGGFIYITRAVKHTSPQSICDESEPAYCKGSNIIGLRVLEFGLALILFGIVYVQAQIKKGQVYRTIVFGSTCVRTQKVLNTEVYTRRKSPCVDST